MQRIADENHVLNAGDKATQHVGLENLAGLFNKENFGTNTLEIEQVNRLPVGR